MDLYHKKQWLFPGARVDEGRVGQFHLILLTVQTGLMNSALTVYKYFMPLQPIVRVESVEEEAIKYYSFTQKIGKIAGIYQLESTVLTGMYTMHTSCQRAHMESIQVRKIVPIQL